MDVQVMVVWKRKPRTVYGLLVPVDGKVAHVREALTKLLDEPLPLERQRVVRLSSNLGCE